MKFSVSKNKFVLKRQSDAGYTLLDALLQLAILMLCMTLFLLLHPVLYRTQAYIVPETLAWERFVTFLTEEMEHCTEINRRNMWTIDYYTVDRENNNDNFYEKSIAWRKRNISFTGEGNKRGNIVILTNVENMEFEIGEDDLYVEVKFLRTGKTHAAYIPLPHVESRTRVDAHH